MLRNCFSTVLLLVFLLFPAFESAHGADSPKSTAKAGQQKGQAADEMKVILEKSMKQEEGAASNKESARGVVVQEGDMAKVNYTVRLETGEIVATTDAAVAHNAGIQKAAWYKEPTELAPEEVLAGQQGDFPGLGDAVIGMSQGERKNLRCLRKELTEQAIPKRKRIFPLFRQCRKPSGCSPKIM